MAQIPSIESTMRNEGITVDHSDKPQAMKPLQEHKQPYPPTPAKDCEQKTQGTHRRSRRNLEKTEEANQHSEKALE